MADNYRRPQSAILFVFFFLLLVTQAHFPDTRCQYYLRIQSIKLIYWQTSQQGVYLSQLAIYFLNLLEEKKKKKLLFSYNLELQLLLAVLQNA